jgi:outer membrane murein-binding lipoprotein Lpp
MDSVYLSEEMKSREELVQQVFDEMQELNAKIAQSQKDIDEFSSAVQKLNEDMAAAKKQWDEMYERHKEIYKPRDISALLERAGLDPEDKG